jgi:glycosyltransferase involved in cell wall biosynthesis
MADKDKYCPVCGGVFTPKYSTKLHCSIRCYNISRTKKRSLNIDGLVNYDGEFWKPIDGYDGVYEISNFGRVKSNTRIIQHKRFGSVVRRGVVFKPQLTYKGYFFVGLWGVDFKCKVVIINKLLSQEQINSIYKVSDVYMTCTRGEGFGLPLAEFSLVSGKPVIAPNKGGHLDFFDNQEFLIDSSYEPCYILSDSTNNMYSSDMNIVESSVNSTRSKMRLAYNTHLKNPEVFNANGEQTRLHIKNYLDFDKNVELFIKVLEIRNEQ